MDFAGFLKLVEGYKNLQANMGRLLIDAKQSYGEWVGEGINTWRDFLEQPEVGLTVREANSLIQLAEWLEGIETPISELNLSTARFAAQRGITDPDLVEDMKVLSLKDFKERHYDVVQKVDNAPRTYTYMLMKRCNETGSLQKVYDDEKQEALKEIE